MLELNLASDKPIFSQIVDAIEFRILSGELSSGSLIPSVRELAVSAKVNPNTVSKAYQLLQREGWVEVVRGKGLKVCEQSPAKIHARKFELIDKKIDELASLGASLGIQSNELSNYLSKNKERLL